MEKGTGMLLIAGACVLVLLSLMPLLGTPLPWLRLSIIGSAYYETYAASTALECVGETLQVNGYSVVGWVAAAGS